MDWLTFPARLIAWRGPALFVFAPVADDLVDTVRAEARIASYELAARMQSAAKEALEGLLGQLDGGRAADRDGALLEHLDLQVNRLTSNVRDRLVNSPEYKLTAVRIEVL